jgi:hypothetical protein
LPIKSVLYSERVEFENQIEKFDSSYVLLILRVSTIEINMKRRHVVKLPTF